jgi:hypothetical protein
MIALATAALVIYPIFGLFLSLGVYFCYKKEAAKAETDAKAVTYDTGSKQSVEPLKIGADLKALPEDAESTNAGSLTPSRRTSLGSEADANAPRPVSPRANTDTQRL